MGQTCVFSFLCAAFAIVVTGIAASFFFFSSYNVYSDEMVASTTHSYISQRRVYPKPFYEKLSEGALREMFLEVKKLDRKVPATSGEGVLHDTLAEPESDPSLPNPSDEVELQQAFVEAEGSDKKRAGDNETFGEAKSDPKRARASHERDLQESSVETKSDPKRPRDQETFVEADSGLNRPHAASNQGVLQETIVEVESDRNPHAASNQDVLHETLVDVKPDPKHPTASTEGVLHETPMNAPVNTKMDSKLPAALNQGARQEKVVEVKPDARPPVALPDSAKLVSAKFPLSTLPEPNNDPNGPRPHIAWLMSFPNRFVSLRLARVSVLLLRPT